MDLQSIVDQMNDAVNRWINAAVAYFSDLSRMEQYGWGGVGTGVLLVIVGIVVL